MTPLKRIIAYIIDMCVVGVYIGLLAIVGLSIVHLGHHDTVVNSSFERAMAQLGAFFVLTLPVTVWLAAWEYGAQVTPGKRLMGLKVVTYDGRQLTLRQAFLRSVIKVTPPWELAHAAVWRLVTIHGTGPDIVTYLFLSCSYFIILLNVVLLFLPTSRLLHDRLARTIVR
ncbi:RDD family protein [Alicyclobacillus sp. SO9]|uniref:RDD family protein n=1 Tax=Alicyclobacillus sp. SO9 TaxID=2665646 RepID=UPI0018E7E498|nr:RDD family protein [Alicyclobacillus sp. SO9]QQE80620.1 RDD family protein [Alicyclobacillus sp. SO9]